MCVTLLCAVLVAPTATEAEDDADLVGVEAEIAEQIACDMCGVLAVRQPALLHIPSAALRRTLCFAVGLSLSLTGVTVFRQ